MQLINSIYTLLELTFLGILVAFSPMLIAMDIVIVLKSKRPIFYSILLISGVVTAVYIIFLLASQLISPDSVVSLSNIKTDINLPPIINIAAGLLLFFYGINLIKAKQNNAPVINSKDIKVPEKPYAIFLVSFFKSLLSVTNIFAALIIAKSSVSNKWGLLPSMIAIIWALIVGVLPFMIIGYLKIFKKESLKTIDIKLNKLLSKDLRVYLPLTLTTIGVIFIVNGALDILR